MTRVLQPELLDTLPADNPEAARSRADLRRVNAWMGHRRILLRTLRTLPAMNVGRIVELGAGDGALALSLARVLSARWPNIEITLLDQQRLVARETEESFRRLGWRPRVVQADAFDWLDAESQTADLILANLFLHHFKEGELQRLLRAVAERTTWFVALEPRRHVVPRLGCELLWLIGCNRVTRHDARLSVRAGFRGQELSALWPGLNGWRLREQSTGMFSHLFMATRDSR
jgi:hypothetical protein